MAKQQKKPQQKQKGGPQLATGLRASRGREALQVKKGQSRKEARQARHPKYQDCEVHCACGNSFTTRSVMPKIETDVCSACHPFYSGQTRMMDTAGRVEKFQRKYGWKGGKAQGTAVKKKKKRVADLQG
jgi:large subunit ribosomal protein L31